MGIGGYHLITKVNVSISNGNFETSVEARYQYGSPTDADLFRDKAVGAKKTESITNEAQDANETDICNNVIQSVQAQIASNGSIEKEDTDANEGEE